ncbi:MarR family winged helix-turn-helix transcriptional regulator [Paludibacterium paludis]|uniref:MarR family transcriptional regulator n=1 Tax=Paludibacterium paludis TaxID=1225769 RepID=A0A918UC47_9NEIS|nr:MarR family transcriptional regulator [Paludibacterium paludis]GGY27881.1 MarR family transcriptional regulator [Paludibacterium paludis]
MQTSFLPLVRELARTYQAFEQLSAYHIRQLGLTPPQFDVVATLGNTPGMSCKELSEKTLITKGTLTGVLDRLEEKGLIRRSVAEQDRRSIFIALTGQGEAVFDSVFPSHLDYMEKAFEPFCAEDMNALREGLARLRMAFTKTCEENRLANR